MTEPTTNRGTPKLETTTFHRPWLLKVVIMFVVLTGFGSWGLWDALVAYPARGRDHAGYAEWEYLKALEAADAEDPALYPGQATVENPADELGRLARSETETTNRADSADTTSRRNKRAIMELKRQTWLTALSRLGMLDKANTTYADRNAVVTRQGELAQAWASRTAPAELKAYDIPSQWAIAGVCYAFAAYIGVLFLKVATTSYKWNPAEQQLTLPSNAQITPADLAEVDKRKWDKFIVFLKIKPTHPTLGGQTVRFDTYRHGRLEDWILAMEATAFPESAAASEPDAGDEPAAA